MNFLFILLQIGELFRGNINWRGVLHLVTFIVMGLIVIAFSAFFIKVAWKARKK